MRTTINSPKTITSALAELRFSGEPNGTSKLDCSVFAHECEMTYAK